MYYENLKVEIDGKIYTMKELFEIEKERRREFAKLPFTEKLKIIIKLQKFAKEFGKSDVIVWGTPIR